MKWTEEEKQKLIESAKKYTVNKRIKWNDVAAFVKKTPN